VEKSLFSKLYGIENKTKRIKITLNFASMNNITKNRLNDSGWKEQRKINTDLIRKKYDEIGLEYPEVVDKFLKEYGMLNINPGDKCYFDVSFNAIEAIGCNLDGSYFKECLAEYDINETVYPIGEACRKPIEIE